MTLAVDDRLYVPHMQPSIAARWADRWYADPIRWMISLAREGIPYFAGYLPNDVRRTWLLPPTYKKGEWDVLGAVAAGLELHKWAIVERQSLVLFGSRVAIALFGSSELSEIRIIDGVRYLTLPRSDDFEQYVRNTKSAAKMRMACDNFFTEET